MKTRAVRTHLLVPPEKLDHVYATACGMRGYLRVEAHGNFIRGELDWLVTANPEKVDCRMCIRRMK